MTMPDQAPHAICTIDGCDVKILPNTLYCPVHRALRQYEDQAPQTLDEILDNYDLDLQAATDSKNPYTLAHNAKETAKAALSTQREQAYADGYKKGVLQNPAVAAYLKEDEAREQARQELLDELEAKLPEFKEDDEHDVFVSKAVNVWDITTEFINAKRKKDASD